MPLVRHSPVRIIKALDGSGNIITNKLNLFLNLRWSAEACDGAGGVDIDDFARYIKTGVVWAAYLLERDLKFIYTKFIDTALKKYDAGNNADGNNDAGNNADGNNDAGNNADGNNDTIKDFDDFLKFILIDMRNKVVLTKLNTDSAKSINFGEVNFY
jgi:hypothetical protein